MKDNRDIIEDLKKAMEFYRELGFDYLPVKLPESTEHRLMSADKITDAGPLPLDPCPLPLNRSSALQALRNEIGDCTRCKLCSGRKNIVFGEGAPEARLMFVGEGPGRDEDIQARPFVGEAGQLLTRMLKKLGLRREEVYIANIVKCRPPNNREPGEEEIATCMPFVERQIEIISPAVIVGLGRISTQSLLRSGTPISKSRGKFCEYKNVPFMPTFHPAYLLRNPKDKWLTWDDMQKVLEKLKT
ncbi:MAG: uracil-DNA glycosylase [Nitrospirae bacterium]|nr:uracil-DNA glycosylase [Nitrospirota bacterium]